MKQQQKISQYSKNFHQNPRKKWTYYSDKAFQEFMLALKKIEIKNLDTTLPKYIGQEEEAAEEPTGKQKDVEAQRNRNLEPGDFYFLIPEGITRKPFDRIDVLNRSTRRASYFRSQSSAIRILLEEDQKFQFPGTKWLCRSQVYQTRLLSDKCTCTPANSPERDRVA